MGKPRKQVSNQTRVLRALEFSALGYKDYIGARALLINELPLQGAVLGSSAVEKYIKSLLALRGENAGGHLQKAHITSLKNYAPDLATKLSMEFLRFLQKCYLVRYTDALPSNFNLFVYAREVLAELDHTVLHLELYMKFNRSDGTEATTMFRAAAKRRDQRLYSNNYVLLKQD